MFTGNLKYIYAIYFHYIIHSTTSQFCLNAACARAKHVSPLVGNSAKGDCASSYLSDRDLQNLVVLAKNKNRKKN